MKIYTLTAINESDCKYFANFVSMANHIRRNINPKDNIVEIRGKREKIELTAENLERLYDDNKAENGDNFGVCFWVTQDFGFTQFETEYIIGTIDVAE